MPKGLPPAGFADWRRSIVSKTVTPQGIDARPLSIHRFVTRLSSFLRHSSISGRYVPAVPGGKDLRENRNELLAKNVIQ